MLGLSVFEMKGKTNYVLTLVSIHSVCVECSTWNTPPIVVEYCSGGVALVLSLLGSLCVASYR